MINDVNKSLDLLFDYWNGKITLEDFPEPRLSEHGKCIAYKQSIFHDIYIYEDGYEEWVDIGD